MLVVKRLRLKTHSTVTLAENPLVTKMCLCVKLKETTCNCSCLVVFMTILMSHLQFSARCYFEDKYNFGLRMFGLLAVSVGHCIILRLNLCQNCCWKSLLSQNLTVFDLPTISAEILHLSQKHFLKIMLRGKPQPHYTA